jgi:hypothetical protein
MSDSSYKDATITLASITISDAGPRDKDNRYAARVDHPVLHEELVGRSAATKSQAKTNLLEDALAIASFAPVYVVYENGARGEIRCTGAGGYTLNNFAADGKTASSMGSSDARSCLLEAGRLGAFRGGIKTISINAFGFEPAMRARCAEELAAQTESLAAR